MTLPRKSKRFWISVVRDLIEFVWFQRSSKCMAFVGNECHKERNLVWKSHGKLDMMPDRGNGNKKSQQKIQENIESETWKVLRRTKTRWPSRLFG